MDLIIIAGHVDVDPERREDALVAGSVHMKETRKLAGCINYVWSADPLTAGRIVILERWQTREALEVHFESPHYLAMRNTIASYGICGLDVSKHEVGRTEPVYDPQGRPRADFFSDA